MFKYLSIALLCAATLFCAPTVKADGITVGVGAVQRCGHWETRYRLETYWVPGRFIGYSEVNGVLYPIYSAGYWATRYVPYSVWIPEHCYRPRINLRFWFR